MSRRICPALLRTFLALFAMVAVLPCAALAAPADDARGFAEQGAEHFKASIQPHLEKLQAATPAEIADASLAAQRYRQARLDADAGQALEDLGDAASLKRALPHWELARVSARTADERTMADASVRRVKARLAELARVPEAPPVEVAPVPKPPEALPKMEPMPPAASSSRSRRATRPWSRRLPR